MVTSCENFSENNVSVKPMIKTLRVYLYPDEEQRILLEKYFGSCRFVWNYFLEVRKKYAEHRNDRKKG
jgi:hypothetical protein